MKTTRRNAVGGSDENVEHYAEFTGYFEVHYLAFVCPLLCDPGGNVLVPTRYTAPSCEEHRNEGCTNARINGTNTLKPGRTHKNLADRCANRRILFLGQTGR